MRYAVLFLLLAGFACAEDFTLYSGNSTTVDGITFTFSLNTGRSEGLPEAVRLYEQLEARNSTQGLSYALEEVRDALDAAKADDKLIVRTSAQTVDVYYSGCATIGVHEVCFEDSTYYEEDVSPLGDDELEEVLKTASGYAIPFEVTIDDGTSLEAEREFNEDSVFTNEEVTVTVTVTNDGAISSPRFTLIENPPLPVQTGKTTLSHGSLLPDESVTITYTVQPTAPGKYVFSATGLSIENSTLSVKSPIGIAINLDAERRGVKAPFTIGLTNDYTEDIDVRSATIYVTDSFATLPNASGRKISEKEYSLDPFTLEEEAVLNISGAIFPVVGELSIELSYGGPRDKPYTVSVPYDVVNEEPAAPTENEETEEETAETEEELAETPAQETTETQETPSAQPPVASETVKAEKKGVVRSFLDFLANLFS